MKTEEGLGFTNLSPQEQQVYKAMLSAFTVHSEFVDCSNFNSKIDLSKVMHVALGDNPLIVYFNKTKMEMEESGRSRRIFFTGVCSKNEAEKISRTLDETADTIVSSLKLSKTDEYTKLIGIYEFMQKSIKYDRDELQANAKGVSKNPFSHNAYGALINKLAVCDGFSSAFVLLAKKLGFECMLVVGKSKYSTATFIPHAWNIVKVKNRYYHMDSTWDTRKYNEFGVFSYAYFAMKDDEIRNDHDWDITAAPTCGHNDLSYYNRNGLIVINESQFDEALRFFNSKKTEAFRVKIFETFKLPNNAGDYFAQKFADAVAVPGVRTQISYGWNENTRCFTGRIEKS